MERFKGRPSDDFRCGRQCHNAARLSNKPTARAGLGTATFAADVSVDSSSGVIANIKPQCVGNVCNIGGGEDLRTEVQASLTIEDHFEIKKTKMFGLVMDRFLPSC